MDSGVRIYLDRAENKIILAKTNFEISTSGPIRDTLKIPKGQTFFNDVISQCYFSIFYAAKAYLLSKGIETKAPEEHRKTYDSFKAIATSGSLDKQLLDIYDAEAEKASVLLKIFSLEKSKRGRFTYDVNSNANIPYAK